VVRSHRSNTLYPGETYEVRWYGTDRGQLAEITRERFHLRQHEPQPGPET
jgi:hypothetical protein